MSAPPDLKDLIAAELPSLIALRHDLHRHPELKFEEHRTSGIVQRELAAAGIGFRAGLAKGTGVLAHLPGGKAGDKAIGLRADMDALPITEQNSFAHASTRSGFMHACGHDGHTTVLTGAARVLAKLAQRHPLPRPVTFVFQPAEEGGAGADYMVKDGCLDGSLLGPPVEEMFGLHGWPDLPLGHVVTRPGPIAAACNSFTVRITGKGGHAAFPHLTSDPLIAAANLVVALQSIVSRNVNPQSQAVLSVTRITGGTTNNVIPGDVELEGTIRTLTDPERELVCGRFLECVHGITAAFRCTSTVTWEEPAYPALHNDAARVEILEKIAADTLGPDKVARMPAPVMGGEDFAYYTRHVPACFFMIGLRPAGDSKLTGLHTPTFDFTDDAIATGVELFVRLALRSADFQSAPTTPPHQAS